MQELRSEIVGNRRVRLIAQTADDYGVIIELRGPAGWADISSPADQDLPFEMARRCYHLRVAAQQLRAIGRGKD